MRASIGSLQGSICLRRSYAISPQACQPDNADKHDRGGGSIADSILTHARPAAIHGYPLGGHCQATTFTDAVALPGRAGLSHATPEIARKPNLQCQPGKMRVGHKIRMHTGEREEFIQSRRFMMERLLVYGSGILWFRIVGRKIGFVLQTSRTCHDSFSSGAAWT
jgi:hypothetical protein